MSVFNFNSQDHIKAKGKAAAAFANSQLRGCKYELIVPLDSKQTESLGVGDVNSLKEFMVQTAPGSMYRGEIKGITNKESILIPVDGINEDLPAGVYSVLFSTQVDDEVLAGWVFEAVERLKEARQSKAEQIMKLETSFLTSKFTHASLTQEGSNISLQEVILLNDTISLQDPKGLNEEEVDKLVALTTSTKQEVVEAINHIHISKQLHNLVNHSQLDQGTLFEIHRSLMHRLLVVPDEGLAGEYRKVGIAIHNSKVPRSHSREVPDQMKAFFVTLGRGQRETEDITDFLTRIHSEFQLIHPFRDGNGRVGRIMMNIIAMKKGYPIIFYTPEQRVLFCKACEEAHVHGDRRLFARMLMESFYASLRLYEEVVPNLLCTL